MAHAWLLSWLCFSIIAASCFALWATMYEDGWYSFVPELSNSSNNSNETSSGRNRGHQRKESLLQQPHVRVTVTHCFANSG